MAIARGMQPGRGTAQMAQRMASDPLHQLRMREATLQAGRDKRAVSMESRQLGGMIGQEQARLRGLDVAGEELATRREDLAYKRRVSQFEQEQFAEKRRRAELGLDISKERLAMGAERLAFGKEQAAAELAAIREQTEAVQDPSGMELGLGLLSTGIEGYRSYRDSQRRKIEAQKKYQQRAAYFTYDYTKQDEADDPDEMIWET